MGWIRIDRKIFENRIWTDRPFARGQAWIDLLLLANHQDNQFYQSGKVVDGKRGTVYRSILSLSERWGWDRKKTRRFLLELEHDQMISINASTHGTTITIINYGKYQDVGITDGTTKGQPMGQPFPTYNKDNKENKYINNINNGYDYTSSLTVGGRQLEQPTADQYHEIVDEWNKIPWTINIQEIIPGTKREDEVRVVIGMYGYEGLKGAIQSVKDSDYLHRLGHIKFDNYINRNVVQKLLEGSYQEDYKKGEETDGYDWCFSSTQYDSDPLPGIPAAHFR